MFRAARDGAATGAPRGPVTPTEIRERVAMIRDFAASGDDEAAHAREDALHVDALAWIALNGDEASREVARLALDSMTCEFRRWYG